MDNNNGKGIKILTERYCPVLERNVAVEVLSCGHHESDAVCLFKSSCEKERGGCKNAFLPNSGYSDLI